MHLPTLSPMTKFVPLALILALALPAQAVVLVIDYSYDTSNFFSGNAAAKAALEAAATDIGAAITSNLGAVTTDVYSSTNGSTTAIFDWSLSFTNPSTGGVVTENTFSAPANQITLYAGVRELSGSTLGVGGPSGASVFLNGSGFANQWVDAVAGAGSASDAAMLRGGGPVINTLSGSSTLSGTTANFNLGYGAILGSLSFDSDSVWHYDHTTAVLAGANDFYSVALHEILHTIGVGTSETWNSLTSGTDWTGSNVIALMGTGVNLIDGGGAHIASGTMSTRLSDGLAQEAVMDPTITVGTRKTLTELDLAFLRDLGFTTVPEPSRMLLLFVGAVGLLRIRRREMAVR